MSCYARNVVSVLMNPYYANAKPSDWIHDPDLFKGVAAPLPAAKGGKGSVEK